MCSSYEPEIYLLAQNLLDTAAEYGRRPALRMGETVLTYEQFGEAAGRVAAGLEARGVVPGDRVGLVLPNVLSFPVLYLRGADGRSSGGPDESAADGARDPLLPAGLGSSAGGRRTRPRRRRRSRLRARSVSRLWLWIFVQPGALMAVRARAGPVVRAGEDPAAILYTSGNQRPVEGGRAHARESVG